MRKTMHKNNTFPFRLFFITLLFTLALGGCASCAYFRTKEDSAQNSGQDSEQILIEIPSSNTKDFPASVNIPSPSAFSSPDSPVASGHPATEAEGSTSGISSDVNPAPSGHGQSDTPSDLGQSDVPSDLGQSDAPSDHEQSDEPSGHEQSDVPSDLEQSDAENASENNEPAAQSVSLCLAGDLMCLAGQQYSAERKDGSHDYTGTFALIQPYLADCDIAFANLETVLSESNPYTTQQSQIDGAPNCNAPADYLDSLRQAGFSGFTTANNHCLDGGLIGISETLENLDKYNFPHTGTYDHPDTPERFLLFDQNGIRVAILSFTELINRRSLLTPEELSQSIDCYDSKTAQARIAQAKEAGAEYIIVYIHWGSENTHEVRAYQRAHAKDLAEAGADLIIGSHPHCLQEYEMIPCADGKEVPCFYSLGNFASSMARDINKDTVLLFLTLERQEDKVVPTAISLLPCHVLSYYNGSSHVIVPLAHPVDQEKAAAELAEAYERISAIAGFAELLQ